MSEGIGMLCYAKKFLPLKPYKVCIKGSLNPILNIALQYRDAAAPLPGITTKIANKPLELSPIVGMICLCQIALSSTARWITHNS